MGLKIMGNMSQSVDRKVACGVGDGQIISLLQVNSFLLVLDRCCPPPPGGEGVGRIVT